MLARILASAIVLCTLGGFPGHRAERRPASAPAAAVKPGASAPAFVAAADPGGSAAAPASPCAGAEDR